MNIGKASITLQLLSDMTILLNKLEIIDKDVCNDYLRTRYSNGRW